MRVGSILKNRVTSPLKGLFNDISHKYVRLGFARFFASLFNGTKFSNYFYRKKHDIILNELKKELGDVLDRFKSHTGDVSYNENAPIWISWLQGYDSAPPLVKKCIDNIKKSTTHPVNLITLENMSDYVQLPDYIVKKFKEGKIINAQFADILRMTLLSEYGGLWIDATIFIPNGIPESVFQGEFYTCKRKPVQSGYVSDYKWTTFLIGCQKGCVIADTVKELFFEYLKRRDYLVDYFLFDYFLYLTYENIPHAKELIDNLPYNNSKIEELQGMMNMPFNEEEYKKLIEAEDTIFYKLSWRMPFDKCTSSGEQTFFDFFLNNA